MRVDDRPLLVSRCICTGHDFLDARAAADRVGAQTVAELQRVLPIATGCGRCIPYVQRTLETGATVHPVLDDHEVAEFTGRSGLVRESEGDRKEGE